MVSARAFLFFKKKVLIIQNGNIHHWRQPSSSWYLSCATHGSCENQCENLIRPLCLESESADHTDLMFDLGVVQSRFLKKRNKTWSNHVSSWNMKQIWMELDGNGVKLTLLHPGMYFDQAGSCECEKFGAISIASPATEPDRLRGKTTVVQKVHRTT